MKKTILIVSTLLIFVVFNYAIFQKEELKKNGETVLLALAPVDPRSLIQGDYMRLRYAIQQKTPTNLTNKKQGFMIIAVDQNKVGTFQRFYKGEPLAANEILLPYQNQNSQLRIKPDSFMLQEGHAKFYTQAKYGVFTCVKKENCILVGLADDKMKMIQPPKNI